jgi:hypothetical protein
MGVGYGNYFLLWKCVKIWNKIPYCYGNFEISRNILKKQNKTKKTQHFLTVFMGKLY